VEGRLGNYEKGLEHANRALEIIWKNREKMFAGKDPERVLDAAMKNPGFPPDVILIKAVTSAEGAKTTIYYLKEDYKETIRQGEKAIRHFQNVEKAMTLAPEREQISYFEGLGFVTLAVGDAYRNRGEVQKGREYLEKSRDYFKKARLPFGDVIAEGFLRE
jgi:tetratricopeptide (TPR) repeat protein